MINSEEFQALASYLQTAALVQAEPSADLWQRIARAHVRRVRRARLRYAGGAATVALICALIIAGSRWHADEAIDWQARAQALELQLAALDRSPGAASAVGTGGVEGELAQIDRRLQTEYEQARYTNKLVPLWKRRSELLDTLIVARKRGLALTRI